MDSNNVTLSLTSGGETLVLDPLVTIQEEEDRIERLYVIHQLTGPNPKTSFVRLTGKPLIETTTARGRTEFSVLLKAPDPIKYEYLTTGTNIELGYRTKSVSGTDVTFNNLGNTRTPVIIELTGPVPAGATIRNSINYISSAIDDVIETITVVKAVPTGSKLEIDTLNREAILVTGDEVENARSYISTLSSWFYIQPDSKAANLLRFTSGTGSCKIFYRSGWIA